MISLKLFFISFILFIISINFSIIKEAESLPKTAVCPLMTMSTCNKCLQVANRIIEDVNNGNASSREDCTQ